MSDPRPIGVFDSGVGGLTIGTAGASISAMAVTVSSSMPPISSIWSIATEKSAVAGAYGAMPVSS